MTRDLQRWDVGSGPGVTALGLAAARAVESSMPDRLIDDPYAVALFEAADADLPMLVRWPADETAVSDRHALHLHGSRYIGVRSRFYDDFLLGAVGDGAGQAVLLGAGLDTRAYRLDWPSGLRIFELDQPGVLHFKDSVLEERAARAGCPRVAVGVDLRDDWPAALLGSGFDPAIATAWVAEGLVAYLPSEAEERLVHHIDGMSGPGSRLALDRIAGDLGQDSGRLTRLSERAGIDMKEMLSTELGADLAAWLTEHGWTVDEQAAEAVADRYDRDLANPFAGEADTRVDAAGEAAEPPWLHTLFLTAERATS